MANMMGVSLAGGMRDLGQFTTLAQGMAGIPGLPVPISPLASMSEEEVRFYETSLLAMQKEIFQDQAVMHEAYLGGGMDAIRELRAAGVIDAQTERAWADIDQGHRNGSPDMIHAGNKMLLYREQHDIIQDDYANMYRHPDTGKAFTYLMTTIGEPSIPGAMTFAQASPLTVRLPIVAPVPVPPGVIVPVPLPRDFEVRTPLPAGNLADFDYRWNHLVTNTVPAYTNLLDHHPDQARAIVASPFDQRLDQFRLSESAGRLLRRLADWDVKVRRR